MNKKGVIGTTTTWIAATFVIIFILIFYFIVLFFMFINPSVPSLTLEVESGKTVDISKTKSLVSFLEINNDVVSNWADNNAGKEEIEIAFQMYFEDIDDEFYVRFAREGRELEIGKPNVRVAAPSDDPVVQKQSEPRDIENSLHKIHFISKEGNVVEVAYQNVE